MRITCPKCKKTLEGEGDLVGREADCPACGATFTIQAPPAEPPPAKQAPAAQEAAAAPTPPPQKRSGKPLLPLLAGLGAVVVMAVAFLFVRTADSTSEKALYDYATRRLAKDSGYTGDDLKLAIEMAGYHHDEARTIVIRTGQKLSAAATREQHYDALRSFIDKEIREIKTGSEAGNADALPGYWFTYSFARNACDYSCWSSSGDYVSMAFEGKSLEGFTKGTPRRGKWTLTGQSLDWGDGNVTPVVYLTPRHLVTRNVDGSLTHYRRLSVPSSQQAFDELLRTPE